VSLHAHDAREAGASLRDIAELLLGPGDWPGDGEWRKSQARRLVQAGASLIRSGPRSILMEAGEATANGDMRPY
jgi:hypothetical protein